MRISTIQRLHSITASTSFRPLKNLPRRSVDTLRPVSTSTSVLPFAAGVNRRSLAGSSFLHSVCAFL